MDLEAEIRLYEQARRDKQRGQFTVAQVEWAKKLLQLWSEQDVNPHDPVSNGEDEGLWP